jgi:hypothetical protein
MGILLFEIDILIILEIIDNERRSNDVDDEVEYIDVQNKVDIVCSVITPMMQTTKNTLNGR